MVAVVSSKPALDRIVKGDKYARWCAAPLDLRPGAQDARAYKLDGDRYGLPLALGGPIASNLELFPGLVIELRELWL